ncbi:FAD/NAD(P)-binding domain-containing protein [Canariomyces notabilis]|uniref:FAD/NAD(P)-binding domain-containing protein n=1 Tax=Canariomyces notabilis TaxID=2074819 RepID=A0AAN6QHK0_9PEZI|nr:FAD/NAD(P)-binding domain-containing protein [Canariomyces arenarius]
MAPDLEEFDIVVVGAGLSGINTAYRLKNDLPRRKFAILEARNELGGTWGFWKYPGVRSDSAMGLFGFPWYPWPHEVNMAQGPALKAYMQDAAASQGIDKKIRFGHRLVSASWSIDEQRWTLQVDVTLPDGGVRGITLKTWWLINATGYYRYDKALPVHIPGIDKFGGQVIHPQFWDDSLDYAGKRIVIIGSGATAITLLPALAETAGSVTMLQRSPSYVLAMPRKSSMFGSLSKFMPARWARTVIWWQRMFVETLFVRLLLTFPRFFRKLLITEMQKQLPEGFNINKHFTPRYNPFEQRLCFCPGGDFFKALHRPNAHIVTDTIETVTQRGILLKSGETLEADIIITATGLYVAFMSGISVTVDGEPVIDQIGQRYTWNGTMLEGLPNSGLIVGYTAATWTPGADVRARQLIKVIKYMEKTGATSATPYIDPSERARLPNKSAVSLSSTYVTSAVDRIPRAAGVGPWRNGMDWVSDTWRLLFTSVKSGMRYTFATKSKHV